MLCRICRFMPCISLKKQISFVVLEDIINFARDNIKKKKMKRGLVLEGGGMRGLFTAGVLDVLLDHDIKVDGMIGVSAGALFGCNFKSKQKGRALRYNIRFKDDPRYMGFRSFIKTGNFINAEFAYHTMPLELDIVDNDAFTTHPADFYLVCTDIETGQPVYQRIDSIDDHTLEWFRATGSMPIVSTPVHIDGRVLLDGGMVDCIPLQYFQSIGYEKNLVILTQPDGYQKTPNKMVPLFRMVHRKYPKVAECMAKRHIMYNNELEYVKQQVSNGNTLAIYPDQKLNIGRTEQSEEKMRNIYEQGRAKASSMIDEITAFLK